MGDNMYSQLRDKLDMSLFIKIEPNKPAHVRLLDHPWISQKQFVDQQTGEYGDIRTIFSWPVWDYTQQRVRILSQGKSVFDQIASNHEAWPGGDTMPSVFDLKITRTGTGLNSEYTVSAIPYAGTMPRIPRTELPDMAAKSGGIPVQQVLEGKRPPVIAPTPNALAGGQPVAPRITHQNAERLAAQEALSATATPAATPSYPSTAQTDTREPQSGDTVIADVPDGPVNLDDISDFNYNGDDAPDPDTLDNQGNPLDNSQRPDFLT